MQPLNDDMDDLFRRASEEYPLNTTGADWDKVLQQLHHNEGDLPKEDKKNNKYLWLLLLLPVGFVWGIYFNSERYGVKVEGNKTTITKPVPSTAISKRNDGVTFMQETDRRMHAAKGNKEAFATSSQNSKTVITASEPSKSASEGNDNNGRFTNEVAGNAKGNNIRNTTRISAGTTGKPVTKKAVYTVAEQREVRSKPFVTILKVTKPSSAATNNKESFIPNNIAIDVKDGENEAISKTRSFMGESPTSNAKQNPAQTAIADTNKKSSSTPTDLIKGNESKTKNQNNFKRSFSYSLILGPDLSTVKMQRTSSVGYSLGVMLKYQFVKRISVEAGALWERKNYYTEGKYLDTSRLKLPIHSVVKTANGYCKMIEIPVNVRYDFVSTKNYSWFASGGLSSYLMKSENYNISYERYNQPYVKNYGYTNSTKNWFSIMNLSIGYQQSLGKSASISLAPYIKLPLGGVGIGKLPVSSTGVYVSISRSVK